MKICELLPARSAALILSLVTLATPAAASVLEVQTDGAVKQLETPHWIKASASKPTKLSAAFTAAGKEYGLSPDLLIAVAKIESNMNSAAVSPKGAIGVMQLMPGTARQLGVDPWDTDQNIRGGAAYLRSLLDRFDGKLDLALAAYNAGPAAVKKHGGSPPYKETRRYVGANLDLLATQSLDVKE